MENALQDTYKFFIVLLAILNPIGVVPTFVSMTSGLDRDAIHKIVRYCCSAVFFTIMFSLLLGDQILGFFNISIHSFRVGGGILIGFTAFNMLQGRQNKRSKLNRREADSLNHQDLKEIGVVPLAIPLLSGPGTISAAIIYADHINNWQNWIGATIAVFLLSVILFFVLKFAKLISEKVGRLGLNVMTRLMGLILMAIAIESITAGLRVLLFQPQ